MFPWLDSEPLGDSLWRLWCTSDGLFFTFKEQEARRNRLRRPTQLKKPAYPVICRPGQVPLELLLLQNAEQSIWPQHWNAVLQRTKEDKLIFIDNDLFYKHKIYLSLNSLSKSEKNNNARIIFFFIWKPNSMKSFKSKKKNQHHPRKKNKKASHFKKDRYFLTLFLCMIFLFARSEICSVWLIYYIYTFFYIKIKNCADCEYTQYFCSTAVWNANIKLVK